ncbi:response regulator transcription factor [Methylomonas sp. LL1]|uniref:response regulator n=1 Tax=Methylomonas sp. LL1 TaxID=2785785 RepID=UPI0018C41344|nr:response regulator transcription factor [Methylomonas sp. LL1]QPK64612.1 response regulator transcription factor [Methylomonas sp. LL1]
MIHLMIVDDHALMREGLKQLFEGEDDIIVGAEAASGEEVLAILQKENIDLVLLDLSIPGIHGVELIAKIREMPDSPPILVLSMHNEPQIAKRKLKSGASGYITKDSSPKDLLEAIRKVAAGGRYIAGDIAERIAFEASSAAPLVPHELLSGRELMILRMLAKGKKVHEIAQELDISSKTVSTHKARLMQKMHIDSDVKLVQYAIAHGMTV